MLEAFANSITKLFEEFTWKRFFSFFLAISMLLAGLTVYEKYTSNFKLNHLHGQLTESLSGVTSSDGFAIVEAEKRTYRFLKFIAASIPWFFFGFISVKNEKLNRREKVVLSISFTFSALFLGWIGSLLQTIFWPIFNLLIYPILQLIVTILPMIIVPNMKAYRRKAEEARAAREGLASQ